MLRSASEEGLNIPSTPEFSIDGNLSNSPYPVLNRRPGSSRIVSPTSAASESSSYQASMPGSGRSEQDSFTTSGRSERSYDRPGLASQDTEPRQKYFGVGEPGPRPRPGDAELTEALLRTGYFLPEYKH